LTVEIYNTSLFFFFTYEHVLCARHKESIYKRPAIITIILLSLLLVGYLCYDLLFCLDPKLKLDDDKMATYITKDTVCSFPSDREESKYVN
jgi:hypothetical protein